MPQPINISILSNGIKSSDIPILEEWGNHLANGNQQIKGMSTSQLRKFFGEIKRIQADFENCKSEIILLDPKIAYSVGRAKKEAGRMQVAISDFYNVLKPLIREIDTDQHKFKNFVLVCEAIVAYHRAKGGI